jgi:hypothetical protein
MSIRRAILKGHLFGTVATRNMFVCDLSISEGDSEYNCFDEYLTPMLTAIRGYLAAGWTTETLEIQARSGSTWFTNEEVPYAFFGQGQGDQLANAVAAVFIGKVTALHAHGRKFWSGLNETAVSGNSLVAGAVSAFAAGCALYIAPLTTTLGSNVQPGIIAKDGNFHSFTSGFVSSLLGSMRRRKPGLGI